MERLTTAEFIAKAKEIHGDKYDYSKVNYSGTFNKVCIICPIHGEFWQSANGHLRGRGCPKCNKSKKCNQEEFIQKARKVHGDKYDYSKTVYTKSANKVIITCPIHGDFEQRAGHHIAGSGCPKCVEVGVANKYNTEIFIQKARKVHGNKYDYSKVNYIDCRTPITIICPKHGEFEQSPAGHLSGQGCYKCGIEATAEAKRLTNEEFIRRAKLVHGDRYDYSKVNYVNSDSKVIIICPEHGEFEQIAYNHLIGANCPICANKNRLDKIVSDGELDIMSVLSKWNIAYETQIRLSSTVNQSGYMYVDFYLPDYNTFIEYNGKQHYVPIECMGGQLKFEQQQARDKELRQYCKDNNINLIEIRYDEDVWEVLNEKLCR